MVLTKFDILNQTGKHIKRPKEQIAFCQILFFTISITIAFQIVEWMVEETMVHMLSVETIW